MPGSSVAESPPPTAGRPHAARPRDAAALVFQRRMKLLDRLARSLISFSGIAIICAVLGIGVFLFLAILPLFQGARVNPEPTQSVLPSGQQAYAVMVDEHQERALIIGEAPTVHAVSLQRSRADKPVPLLELEGQQISAVSRILREPTVVLGTRQGDAWIGTMGLQTVFQGAERTIQAVVEPELMVQSTPGVPIEQLGYRRSGDYALLAAIVFQGAHVVLTRLQMHEPLIGPPRRTLESVPLSLPAGERATRLLVNEHADQVLLGTSTGTIARWQVSQEGEPALLETIEAVRGGAVTALAYLLGGRSVVVGGSDGSVATWSLVRSNEQGDGWRLTKIHPFPSHQTAVVSIAPSPRDKGFITVAADGDARLHFMTSERTLASFNVGPEAVALDFAPKANGVVAVDRNGALHHHRIHNPHPEISWRALFGKVWYEGYEQPDYVWQSSGGTDDFESKFSLAPLVFGTLKGTCYALLFAVPLALFSGLYCSQFLDKRLRNRVKSTIELMAALPSVVLGFVAGVLLAPLVQDHLVAVLIAPPVIATVAMAGLLASRQAPGLFVQRAARQHEFWMLLGWILVGMLAAAAVGPMAERAFFQGDIEAWLLQATGIRYDQRNSLVVGWAMGFAVIPIIFTICEDAFSAVPKHLVGASLACGASPWQTAWRVVLPAAGSGVFSAIMVGFGRAVGETMIVLMATGNTPVMDWSLFNGFRALSANIAVEIPEAPYGETLYRVLFVAALLLFLMTFVVNTAAELIRLRLRRQLQGL